METKLHPDDEWKPNHPLLDIYMDPQFNCRGAFDLLSLQDLARGIDSNGLLEPLIIQPMSDVSKHERPQPCPWSYRLLAGHRRYRAMTELTEIESANCVVKHGLSPQEAYDLNITENIERENLNIMEEAMWLHKRCRGISVAEIKSRLKRPERWILVRQKLATMPEIIQLAAAAGSISQYDIETLSKMTGTEQLAAFNAIRSSKGKPGEAPVVPGRQGWRRNRARTKKELGEMVTLLYHSQPYTSLTDRELRLVQATLAWAGRGIDSREFLVERLDVPPECVKIEVDGRDINISDTD